MLSIVNPYCEVEEFEQFVKVASPNDQFEYYFGMCLQDTVLSRQLRKIAYKYAQEGIIFLVQKKLGTMFLYMAIKASHAPPISLIPFSEEKLKSLGKRTYVNV